MTEELGTNIKNAYKVNMIEILRVDEECVSSRIEYNMHWPLTRRNCSSKYEDGDRLENWGRREQQFIASVAEYGLQGPPSFHGILMLYILAIFFFIYRNNHDSDVMRQSRNRGGNGGDRVMILES